MAKMQEWVKINGYPKKGQYVKALWKGKEYEGKITGHVVRFRTGYVAMEVKNGNKKWMPWSSAVEYYVRAEKQE